MLYIQKGLNGTPEVLLDPNTWSADGTVRLGTFAPSKDGKLAVYGMSRSGSDWQEYNVLDLTTQEAARRQDRVGQGLGRGVARQRLLLQPLPGAGEGQGALVDQREPPGLSTTASARRSRRTSWSSRTRRTRSGSTRCRPPKTSASRSSTSRIAAPASRATPSSCWTCRSRARSSLPLIPDDQRRHLQRARKRARRAAGLHRQQRAERPRRPHRPGQAGAGELEGRSCRRSPTRSTAWRSRAARSSRPT